MRYSLITSLLFVSWPVFAQMQPLEDDSMDAAVGQAFVKFENFKASDNAGFVAGVDTDYTFTRLQFGLNIKTLLNIDKVEFGKYQRFDDTMGDQTIEQDLLFYNYALGHIDANGNIVPFEMNDPFIEFAYDETGGNKDLIGLRFGFGKARGTMSNDIRSLTGNIDVTIKDTSLKVDNPLGGGKISLPGPVESTAQLITAEGDPDDIRATYIGIANGSEFNFQLFGFIPLTLTVTDCTMSLVGKNTCYPLNKYLSNPVGVKANNDPQSTLFKPGDGLFISFQTVNNLKWGGPGEELRDTVKGAFFNVPRESLTLNFDQADEGIHRSRTEFISRAITIDGIDFGNARWGTNTIYTPAP
ncbi:MAG: hypothetical protein H7A09_07875 [Oceanospirillaceae bacterium]|nr:hypothetical protein [Oceanospirillaceae bacterium]MCP5335357.1 hypothetical protein [Oceanospirillaceae bacterium]